MKEDSFADRQQPTSQSNDLPSAHDLVIADIEIRKQFGLRKYKALLQPFHGRDQLVDAYQEVLDLVVYLRLVLYERDEKIRQSQKVFEEFWQKTFSGNLGNPYYQRQNYEVAKSAWEAAVDWMYDLDLDI